MLLSVVSYLLSGLIIKHLYENNANWFKFGTCISFTILYTRKRWTRLLVPRKKIALIIQCPGTDPNLHFPDVTIGQLETADRFGHGFKTRCMRNGADERAAGNTGLHLRVIGEQNASTRIRSAVAALTFQTDERHHGAAESHVRRVAIGITSQVERALLYPFQDECALGRRQCGHRWWWHPVAACFVQRSIQFTVRWIRKIDFTCIAGVGVVVQNNALFMRLHIVAARHGTVGRQNWQNILREIHGVRTAWMDDRRRGSVHRIRDIWVQTADINGLAFTGWCVYDEGYQRERHKGKEGFSRKLHWFRLGWIVDYGFVPQGW